MKKIVHILILFGLLFAIFACDLFPKNTYTISSSAELSGVITPFGEVEVVEHQSKTFYIYANHGYIIDKVYIDGVYQGPISTHTFENITSDHSIYALFLREDEQTSIVTASAGSGGSISPSGETTVFWEQDMTFTITADPEYVISHVIVDGVDQGPIPTYTFTDVTTDHEINADFMREDQQSYTITASAGSGGSISPSGETTVFWEQDMSFTITADPEYVISQVIVDGVDQGSISSYTFYDVISDHEINADFIREDQQTFAITASAGLGGSISPDGTSTVSWKEDMTFTITPDSGYIILQVTVDGVDQGPISTYTFDDVTTDHTISVSFDVKLPDTYTISAFSSFYGNISPSGKVVVDRGADQYFSFNPDIGCHLNGILVDGAEISVTEHHSGYWFSNVCKDHIITIQWKPPF